MKPVVYNSPSLANSDLLQLGDDIRTLYESGVRWFHIDLMDDLELRMMLALHLVPFGVRMAYDLDLHNPLLVDIKTKYTMAYNLAVVASEELRKHYNKDFPAISAFIDGTIASARKLGYVETLFGRRRYLPDINAKNATARSLAERNAVNAPIQGTSADIIKIAMTETDREIRAMGLKSKMVLQIHDELVFDAAADEIETLRGLVMEKMQNVIKLSIPLTVECNYGKNWLEAH